MKKLTKSFLVMILGLLMSVNVMADVQTGKTGPDYPTDYYMIVESKAGGIDIYSQPDLESTRLNDEQIPNGTALHIEGEVEDTENNRTWGYTEYHGMYGYAPLDECRPADSRKEAIDSELYIAGKDQVNYNADYDVNAYAEEGSQKLYQGPGTKYGEVPGVRDIENGESRVITQDAEMVDGSHWGVTTVDGTEDWVDLEKRANNLGKPVGSHAVKASNPYCTAIQGQEPLYRALQLSLSSADRTDLGDQIFSLRCQGHTCPIPNEERNTPLPL